MADCDDGVDLLLSMLEEDHTNGIDDTSTLSSAEELPDKNNEGTSEEVMNMKAKMLAMEKELALLKQQLNTSSENKVKVPGNNTPGVGPTAFKRGKRVAHLPQGADVTRPPSGQSIPTDNHHRMKQTTLVTEDKDCVIEKYSGLRIRNPLISRDLMDERMSNRQLIKIPRIEGMVKDGDIEGDWVTMGVVVSKSLTKDTCKGKKFSIWRISDLSSQTANISLFLFDRVYHAHWKMPVGHVIALLNCNILTNNETNSSTGISFNNNKYSLSLDNPAKLMDMGVSADFVMCKATTKAGKQCQNYASRQFGGFCDYHVQNEYSKMRSKRMNLQGGYGPTAQNIQKRVLGSSQVMYQGHLFTGGGASNRGTKRERDDTTGQRLFAPGAKREMKEVEELLGITENKPISSGRGLPTSSRKADEEVYKQLIKGLTPGALCLQKHLQKHPKNKSEIDRKEKSALELLKEHTIEDKPYTCDDSDVSCPPVKRPKIDNHKSSKPTLSKFEEFDLFKPDKVVTVKQEKKKTTPTSKSISPSINKPSSSVNNSIPSIKTPSPSIDKPIPPIKTPSLKATGIKRVSSHDRAKEKALAMVKNKGPLRKLDPNRIHSNKVLDTDMQDKIKQRLPKNDELGEEENNENIPEGEKRKAPAIEGSEFEKILNAKSIHNWAIEEDNKDRQEAYFNNLEKKEQLQDKLSQLMELNVRVVQCTECNYIAESMGERCRAEGHSVNRLRALKKCFECSGCGQRTYTYNQRYPSKACSKCGENKFKRCSLYKVKAGPKLPTEELLLRGEERKFLNSLN